MGHESGQAGAVSIAIAGIQSLLLINGGAAVALLAFYGDALATGTAITLDPAGIKLSLLAFAAGVLLGTLTAILAYIAQLTWLSSGRALGANDLFWRTTAVAASLLSATCFAVGVWIASQAIAIPPPSGPAAITADAPQRYNSAENDFVCTAPLPPARAEFSGVVRHVIDGDSFCVGPATGDGSTWIEVRLMDLDAPEHDQRGGDAAEEALSRATLNQPAECIVTAGENGRTRSWDRVHAICRVGGVPIGEILRPAPPPGAPP